MRKINSIFTHHSASNFGSAKLIDLWHKERGYTGIGYHYVVLNGFPTSESYKNKIFNNELLGFIDKGRDLNEIGSHVAGHNKDSIGVCLVHDNMPYIETQLESYRMLAATLANYFKVPIENIKGHYEVDKNKPLCPSLDMDKERKIIAELMHNMPDVARDFMRIKYISS
jgi:hypothetical protein